MKNITSLFIGIGLIGFAGAGVGADEVTPSLVTGEYVKIQNEFQVSLSTAKRSLRDLENDRRKSILNAQSQARKENEGIQALKRYDLLLSIRYVNEQGVHQAAMEISTKDQENLNRLFDNYLRATPFVGRTSAGFARKQIEWGMKRLEELAKVNAEPTETNNPELEIIAKQTRDADQKIKTVTELASRLGVKLNENAAVATTTEERRDIASEPQRVPMQPIMPRR